MQTDSFRIRGAFPVLFFVAACCFLGDFARGDERSGKSEPPIKDFFGQGNGEFNAFPISEPKLTTRFAPAKAKQGDVVTLTIQLELPPEHYTYPLEAPTGNTSKIVIKEIAGLEPVDAKFKPAKPPKVVRDDVLDENIYKHVGGTTWTRRYRVTGDADAGTFLAKGTLRYQMCNAETCKPPKTVDVAARGTVTAGDPKGKTETAPPGGNPKAKSGAKAEENKVVQRYREVAQPTLRGTAMPISFEFAITPTDAKPGDEVTVSLKATLKSTKTEKWHAFAITHKKGGTGLPVVITVQKVNGLEPVGKGWRPDKAPKVGQDVEGNTLLEHFGEVTWSRKFKVAEFHEPGAYGLRGKIRFQICNEGTCLSPKNVSFALGDLTNEADAPAASNQIDDTPFPQGSVDQEESGSLPWFLFAAFLGGMSLNVMPCVLPVIAIKVMSFVQQAGESRKRILALNIAYSIGVVSVFLALATAAILLQLRWGGLFQKPEFNLVMACIIFAMGLSLLGVFEIPVPGMIGSAAGKQHKEGLLGAFVTGIFATLLATPCTGPFMGTTIPWSLRQPTAVTFLIWLLMGLGMAFPYLVLGAFPRLIKFLPKPGNWMVRFKEIAGFILMGTVIFFISFLSPQMVVPLLVMLMGIAIGLWMIGNLYAHNSHIKHKTIVRISAFTLMALICGFGYSMTVESEHKLPWKEFNDANLQAALDNNQTVLVDFTADWCTNCKVNEKFALNRRSTLEFVKKHNVAPLVADNTNQSEHINRWLDRFDTDGVPLTVIFPANRPDKPIVLRAIYSNATLLEKLEEAVAMPKSDAKASAGEKQASIP